MVRGVPNVSLPRYPNGIQGIAMVPGGRSWLDPAGKLFYNYTILQILKRI